LIDRPQPFLRFSIACSSVPSKKILHEQMFVVAHEAHATVQSCRHTKSEAFAALKGLCDIYVYRIKFGMMDVREDEIALRKLFGGTRNCAP